MLIKGQVYGIQIKFEKIGIFRILTAFQERDIVRVPQIQICFCCIKVSVIKHGSVKGLYVKKTVIVIANDTILLLFFQNDPMRSYQQFVLV